MLKKNKKMIILLAIVAGMLFTLRLLNRSLVSVVSSIPEKNSENIEIDSKIKLVFDQKITTEGWEIKPSPYFLFQTSVEGKILEIIPENSLERNTSYVVEIKNQKYPRLIFSLIFKTASLETGIPIITPSSEQLEVDKFYKEWNVKIKKDEPLGEFLPYKTNSLYIYYIKALTLIVISPEDTPELRKEVNDWIRSKGVDPATHTIKWEVHSTLPF